MHVRASRIHVRLPTRVSVRGWRERRRKKKNLSLSLPSQDAGAAGSDKKGTHGGPWVCICLVAFLREDDLTGSKGLSQPRKCATPLAIAWISDANCTDIGSLFKLDDIEGQPALVVAAYFVAQAFVYAVVIMKSEDNRLYLFKFVLRDIYRVANDDFVAALAGASRSPIENAAARPAFAINDVGADAGAGRLVPDIDELHGQYARCLAMIGIKRNGTMVIEVGTGDPDAMELAAYDFSHVVLWLK